MKKVMTFLVAAMMLIMMVGGQTDQPPPPLVITISPSTSSADQPTVTTHLLSLLLSSHRITDDFFIAFGFMGIFFLLVLSIIMWNVFKILRGGRQIDKISHHSLFYPANILL
ncbi:hypothetical protein P8452_43621 [Trifolium repens]|nr:hypothetical protein QL285_028541 [Trifolium repens]WJX58135.1 hypothetical protein P8452_43621 [Trifolium repens]